MFEKRGPRKVGRYCAALDVRSRALENAAITPSVPKRTRLSGPGNGPDADLVVGVSREQGLAIGRPRERNALGLSGLRAAFGLLKRAKE